MVQTLDDTEPKMTPEQFIYWLQGFFEINGQTKLTDKQVQIIKDHLQQVFKKETPTYTTDTWPKPTGDDPHPPIFIC